MKVGPLPTPKLTSVLQGKLRQTTCWIYDFDGVMTDNRVLVLDTGQEAVFCHRGDGWAVKCFKELGLRQFILSTEKNPVVMQRARKLGIPCSHDLKDKKQALQALAKREKIDLTHAAYIGNDENDLEAMRLVGLRIVPADAAVEVKRIAHVICRTSGGYGVLREILEYYRLSR